MMPLKIEDVNLSHRNSRIVKILLDDRTDYDAAGHPRVIAQLADLTWWIVPDDRDEEDECPDVGPYDSVEDALAFFLLLFGDKRG